MDVASPLLIHEASNSSQPLIPTNDNNAMPTSPPESPTIWDPPRTQKMPPLNTFRLTKELVQQRVKDNVIIVTFGNYAFMDFILTWVKHLTDLHLSNFLVGKLNLSYLVLSFSFSFLNQFDGV